MADLMKVVRGLAACGKDEYLRPDDCKACPYASESCQQLNRDALELIEEQQLEIIECRNRIIELLKERSK